MYSQRIQYPSGPIVQRRPLASYERVRWDWDIDREVIRGRDVDFETKFVPDSLSKVGQLAFLGVEDRRFLSQIQGRTYIHMCALLDRYTVVQALKLACDPGTGTAEPGAWGARVRQADERLQQQKLFRRLDAMMAAGMPSGYALAPEPGDAARGLQAKGHWALLALTLEIELSSQAHYWASIEPDDELSALWKDVYKFRCREASQHAIVDELEWRRVDAGCCGSVRDEGVDEFIALIGAVDATVQRQAGADTAYFIAHAAHRCSGDQARAVHDLLRKAYRWQYVVLGADDMRYSDVLASLTTPVQRARISAALAPVVAHACA